MASSLDKGQLLLRCGRRLHHAQQSERDALSYSSYLEAELRHAVVTSFLLPAALVLNAWTFGPRDMGLCDGSRQASASDGFTS